MQNEIRSIAELLGAEQVLHHELKDVRDLEEIVRQGLPKRALQRVAADLALKQPRSEVIYQFVPESTYKRKQKLSLEVSEKTVRIARLIALASNILGNKKSAISFLTQVHPLLDNRKPYEVALTEVGSKRVEELLWKIFYGLPL